MPTAAGRDRSRRGARRLAAAGTALVTALVPAAGAQALSHERRTEPAPPCTAGVPAAPFGDRGQVPPVHRDAVDCLAFYGVTQGMSTGDGAAYAPFGDVTRGQMASFLADTVTASGQTLPEPEADFDDIAGSVHARSIRQLATAGVLQGRGEGRYAPGESVTRGQVASMLVRTAAHVRGVDVETLLADSDVFDDIAGSVHERAIAGARSLGLVSGVTRTRYEPGLNMTRAQLASVLSRWLRSEAPASASCTNPEAAYSLHYPSEWQVNDGSVVPVCSVLDPEQVEVPPDTEIPVGNAVTVRDKPAPYDVVADPGRERLEHQVDLTVDGQRAVRQDLVASGEGLLPAGLRYARYVVDRGDSTLVASTFDVEGSDHQAARGVLTRMVLSLDLTGQGLPPFLLGGTESWDTGEGHGLGLVAVRTGEHARHDRVVFEFAGDQSARVGWKAAGWTDTPRAQGSGQPVEIAGSSALALLMDGQSYPTEPGVPSYDGPERIPGPGSPVEEVVVGTVYEGDRGGYIGADRARPFRVLRLPDPERVVVDVLRPGASPSP